MYVENGVVNYGDLTEHSEANFRCNMGFTLVGQEVVFCTRNGSSVLGIWANSNTVCEGKQMKAKLKYALQNLKLSLFSSSNFVPEHP